MTSLGEQGSSCLVEDSIRCSSEWEVLVANQPLDVAKNERSGVGFGIRVFPRVQEEEKRNKDHVGSCTQEFRGWTKVLGNVCDAADDKNRD